MGLLDRLLGRDRRPATPAVHHQPPPSGPVPTSPAGPGDDAQAIERYRYLLRTAPPDQVEQAHAEAFAQLSPEQRQQVLGQLAAAVPESERPTSDDPRALARTATRAEMRSPGTLERTFGGPGPGRGGPGFGSMVGASLLGTIGGLVVGTAVADALFDSGAGDGGLVGGEEPAAAEGADGFGAEDLGPGGGDFGSGDFGGSDFGGDLGGF